MSGRLGDGTLSCGFSSSSIRQRKRGTGLDRVGARWSLSGAAHGRHIAESPQALWLMSRDDSTPNYTVLSYDARSVSRVYKMSFSEGVWKMGRQPPAFSHRH